MQGLGTLGGTCSAGWRRVVLIAVGLVAVGLMVLALVPSSAARHPSSAARRPQAVGVKGAAALGRLQSLPLQAQSVISGALGSHAAAFAAERRTEGYALAGGGVAADLNGRGVVLRVSGGTLSLALSGVGRGERLVAPGRVSPTASANRVVYQRAGVREWYAAGPLGIEQGFTLTQRPAGTTGPLTLALRLGGSLRAQLTGSQVRFLASSGAVRARYGGLAAADASGRRLPATLVLEGNQLLLQVSDRGAHYPLRIDPFIQQGPKLTPTDATGNSEFGDSVALSADGNTALIGGGRDHNSVGAAWVFTRTSGTWTQQGPKLTANDETANGQFGDSVALSADGRTALIGGIGDHNSVGAAWVFTRTSGTWSQQGPKLTATDETGNGQFGGSVALSADGSTALIGGPSDKPAGGEVGGGVGAAWVFTRTGGTWTQQGAKLTATDETGNGGFGSSVALAADGNTALIGGPYSVGAAWVFTRSDGTWTQQGPKLIPADETGIGWFGSSVALSADGNTALIGGQFAGAAWVFTRTGGTWTQQGPKLTANDETGNGWFGSSVALAADGNTALIGGYADNNSVGAAWVFTRSDGTWTQQGPKLTATDETGNGQFGDSVALSADGRTALIGGYADNNGVGAAWVFTRSDGTWSQQGPKLTATDETGNGQFGDSVALSADGRTALIGGYADNNYVGAAWVFTRSDGTWTQQGPKLTATDETGFGGFGYSVALSADGSTALIGGQFAGAAWVFTRSDGTWTQQGPKLTANDETGYGGYGFGSSVALSADGSTALIGNLYDNNNVGAAWVFTRSDGTWTQQGPKLTATDETGNSWFGTSVALSADGNTALIGAKGDHDDVGAAWVFTRTGQTWSQQGAKLTATDQTGNGEFGGSVALSADGNTALIGGQFAGAEWVFTRSDGTWTQQGPKLTATDQTGNALFGASVALSADGNTALIGGPYDNNRVGAAWVFTRSDGTWTQQGPKLTATDETANGGFGGSVALAADGNTALIGGPYDNNNVGAAWVFGGPLVGSQQIQPNADSNPAGTAEAFRYTALGTGTASQLSVYVDGTNTATKVIVGLYTNTRAGKPGRLLTSGTIAKPIARAWNTVTVPAARVSAGSDYWLAVLAPRRAGTIQFRDLPDGTGGPNQTSRQKSLRSLPHAWRTGTRYANSPASLYATP
jgi:hypothetical protein